MDSTLEVNKQLLLENIDRNDSQPLKADHTKIDGIYAKYVLVVLVLVSILNFLDRSIIGVLVEDIKADLGLSDAQMGFLGGTAFTVFYATFGVALGRLADVWNRKKLITIGLCVWSIMTALSGFARSFIPLAACRFGVGVGEASASPAVYSMLYDYFSPKIRTTVMAIYLSGAAVGSGLGVFLGGMILDGWNASWPDSEMAPFGIKGWQAAFMIVGFPGVVLALWVATLHEPARGLSDGIASKSETHPFREAGMVIMSMIPIGNLWLFFRSEAGGSAIRANILVGLAIIVVSLILIDITGNRLQWIALNFGIYAAISWAQMLSIRDPVVSGMIFRCKTLRYVIAGDLLISFNLGISFWLIPFLQRYHGLSASEVSSVLGVGNILVGVSGVLIGGILADALRSRTGKGKLYIYLAGVVLSTSSVFVLLATEKIALAYTAVFFGVFSGSMAVGPVMSTVNDLVLPRGRATTMGFYLMVTLLGGAALGPYLIGFISDSFIATGVTEGESLRKAMRWGLLVPIIGFVFIIQAIRHVECDEKNTIGRARSLGEVI